MTPLAVLTAYHMQQMSAIRKKSFTVFHRILKPFVSAESQLLASEWVLLNKWGIIPVRSSRADLISFELSLWRLSRMEVEDWRRYSTSPRRPWRFRSFMRPHMASSGTHNLLGGSSMFERILKSISGEKEAAEAEETEEAGGRHEAAREEMSRAVEEDSEEDSSSEDSSSEDSDSEEDSVPQVILISGPY